MLTNYSEFVPCKIPQWNYITPHQVEISKRTQYLKRYLSTDFVYVYVYSENRKICIKKYYIKNCEKTEDRFNIYEQAIDLVISDVLKYDPFKSTQLVS